MTPVDNWWVAALVTVLWWAFIAYVVFSIIRLILQACHAVWVALDGGFDKRYRRCFQNGSHRGVPMEQERKRTEWGPSDELNEWATPARSEVTYSVSVCSYCRRDWKMQFK